MSGHRSHIAVRGVALAALAGAVLALTVSCAVAAEPGTGWEAFAQVYPTYLHPGGRGAVQIDLMNVGAKPSEGAIRVTDKLPVGVLAVKAGGVSLYGKSGNKAESEQEEAEEEVEGKKRGGARWKCEGAGTLEVTCTSNPLYLNKLPLGQGERFQAIERLEIEIEVEPTTREARLTNEVSVEGGDAHGVTATSDPVTINAGEPEFGLAGWDVWSTNADGTSDTQAGSHPYETTFAVSFNELADGRPAGGEVRDVEVELPPGFFGEPNATPRCSRQQLDAQECPANTEVGGALIMKAAPGGPEGYDLFPVYNMAPPQGVAAEFALKILGKPLYLDAGPRAFGGYPLVAHIDDIPVVQADTSIFTLWGVAPDKSHDAARVAEGESPEADRCKREGCESDAPPRPFLTLPTACGEPQPFRIRALGTWEDEHEPVEMEALSHDALGVPTGFAGCASLPFDPSLSALPESGAADVPAGLGVRVTFPQEALRVPERLVEATVRDTTVTLPPGLVINPGQAAGLQACTMNQAKLAEAQSAAEKEEAPSCPAASRVGRVKVKTPLLEGELESELEGSAYVLAQYEGRPGEAPRATLQSKPPALQLLIALSGDGINLKLVANVHLNEATGQVTTTLDKTPALPFTSFELFFSGGNRAALATPARCGTYTTSSDFAPWTDPEGLDAFPSNAFQIASGPEGTTCPSSPLPFHPELTAGSTTDQAGGYTNFSLLLRHGDGQQRIERLQFKAPPGLTGTISTVAQCPEPQASKGECPEDSKIGSATVASGPGPYPLVIPQPGNPESPIYLTGPYDGAPFGLSIVTHVIAGPFNLGTIITRAKIEIDPVTAQITVTTEPLPQIVDGVPTDLRLIDSVIDRGHFMINPTNCEASSFAGTAWGAAPPGLSEPHEEASISSRFQVGSCRSLQFKPTFKVSTSAHNSRTRGVGVSFHLSLPNDAGLGAEANIHKVKVSLPKKLPTPLKTLQKACLEAVFAANPASCPESSKVATARVSTPLLPGKLTGPAYFVSHGGAKYPELVIVLSGDGVTEQVHGETFISKQGITTGTFSTVPDVPFTNFELTFPQSQYPAFVADGNLCKGTLQMPTEMVAQNGLVLTQKTKISVSDCPKRSRSTGPSTAPSRGAGNKRKACKARGRDRAFFLRPPRLRIASSLSRRVRTGRHGAPAGGIAGAPPAGGIAGAPPARNVSPGRCPKKLPNLS